MRVTSRGPFRLSFLTAINSLLACGKLSGGITLDDQPQGAFRQSRSGGGRTAACVFFVQSCPG